MIEFFRNNVIASMFFNLIASLVTIISLFYAIRSYHFTDEKKLIRDQKSSGTYQKKIRKIPYISRFLEYLKYIEDGNIEKIWKEMISEKRKVLFSNSKYSFECEHRFTHSYKIEYIIPISADKEKANFWILIEFKDLVSVNEVRNIKSFLKTETGKFKTISDDMINEVYRIIDLRFKVTSEKDIKKRIKEYLKKMTIQSVVQQDWRFPTLIAKDLKLETKIIGNHERFFGNMLGHHIWSNVVMVKEIKKWKVEEFQTIAISRWN